jgi:hypothetical protein
VAGNQRLTQHVTTERSGCALAQHQLHEACRGDNVGFQVQRPYWAINSRRLRG